MATKESSRRGKSRSPSQSIRNDQLQIPIVSKPVCHKAKPSSPSNIEFCFVNQLGTREQDEEAKSEVKSHVMRRVWKKHKDSQSKWVKKLQPLRSKEPRTPSSEYRSDISSSGSPEPHYQNSASSSRHVTPRTSATPPIEIAGLSIDTHREDSIDCSIIPVPSGYAHISPRLAAYVFGSDSDPFGPFPIALRPRILEHNHLDGQDRASTSVRQDSFDSSNSSTYTNAALLYITLSWLSARDGDASDSGNFESSFYMQSSLSAINEDLENATEAGVSEGTIAAVACMTNMENLKGDGCKAMMHLNGLEQMVNLRGGLHTISTVLLQYILSTDLLHATSWQTTPRFPRMDFSHLRPLSNFLSSSEHKPILSITFCLKQALIDTWNGTLLSDLQDANELAYFLDITPPNEVNHLNDASIPDRIYSIESHILDLLSRSTHTINNCPADIVTPFLISLLLYIYTNLRQTPTGGSIRRILAERVRMSLEATELTILNCSFSSELTWMLFLGGTAARRGSEDRRWYKEQLWWVLNRNSALDWNWVHTSRVLMSVLWLKKEFLEMCQSFWLETLDLEWVASF
ncbi:hypothetical protein VTL71DRAFT_14905 [Oculimacula yallundae]|uniref:Uncharacterized protein n=1 Tax=Oculimacula yallundae TaxID=86028 RepID=A0ABR4CF39_9HELO